MNALENVSFPDFKKAAAEFFNITRDVSKITIPESDGGFKCLSIMYLNRDNWDERAEIEGSIIIGLACKRLDEIMAANIWGD